MRPLRMQVFFLSARNFLPYSLRKYLKGICFYRNIRSCISNNRVCIFSFTMFPCPLSDSRPCLFLPKFRECWVDPHSHWLKHLLWLQGLWNKIFVFWGVQVSWLATCWSDSGRERCNWFIGQVTWVYKIRSFYYIWYFSTIYSSKGGRPKKANILLRFAPPPSRRRGGRGKTLVH